MENYCEMIGVGKRLVAYGQKRLAASTQMVWAQLVGMNLNMVRNAHETDSASLILVERRVGSWGFVVIVGIDCYRCRKIIRKLLEGIERRRNKQEIAL